MFRKICIITIAIIGLVALSRLSYANMMCVDHAKNMLAGSSEGHEHGEADATTQATANKVESVNVGNKICPVTGEKIDEKLKATYEYKGKIYNLCCASCIDEFKKDPEKYIKKTQEETKSPTLEKEADVHVH